MVIPALLFLFTTIPRVVHGVRLPPSPAIDAARYQCRRDCDAIFLPLNVANTAEIACGNSCGDAGYSCEEGCPFTFNGSILNPELLYDPACIAACHAEVSSCLDACAAPRLACDAACDAIGTSTSTPATVASVANSTPAPVIVPTITLTLPASPPPIASKPSTTECVFYAAEITLCQGAEDVSDLQGVLSKVCDPKVITALGITSAALVFTPAVALGATLSEATIALENACQDLQLSGAAGKIVILVNKICRSSDNSLADKAGACGLLGRRGADRSRRFCRHARRDVHSCVLGVFPDPSTTTGYPSLQSLCAANIVGIDPVVDDFCTSPGFPALVRSSQEISIISGLAANVPAESCAAVSGAVAVVSARP